jgi:hypothetical protein
MQIFGQMARVPVTARQKFNEAGYFYNGMLAQRTNVIVFPYYLSAFLSAFRSVTFFLQKQYSNNAEFKSWYAQKVAVVIADPVLAMLAKKRTAAVHLEPIDLFFTQSFQMPARYGGSITTKQFELVQDQEPGGQLKTTIKVDADGVAEEVPPVMIWHFTEEDRDDLAKHCYHGLESLDSILTELEGLRASMGLVSDPDASDFPSAE